MRILIQDDEDLKEVDDEIRTIRSLLDNAEAELHRFNFRVRKIMRRVEKRLSSTVAMSNCTQTTLSMR